MPKPYSQRSHECSATRVTPSPKTVSTSVTPTPKVSSARATISNAVRGHAHATAGNGRSIGGKAMRTKG